MNPENLALPPLNQIWLWIRECCVYGGTFEDQYILRTFKTERKAQFGEVLSATG